MKKLILNQIKKFSYSKSGEKMSTGLNLIKELREKTGVGFLDCKLALNENNNNLEASIDYLRKKGLAKASKKSSREANEGVVSVYNSKNKTVLLKINTETDFAAKNDVFLNFVDEIGDIAIKINSNIDREGFLDLVYENKKISDRFTEIISKIGENILLSDLIIIEHDDTNTAFYVHNAYRSNSGKIISIVKYSTKKLDNFIEKFSKNICMHIAASKPEAIDIKDLHPTLVEREKNVQRESIVSSGKPANIVEKILEGKMNKFYSEVTLLNQTYIINPDQTVRDAINEISKDYSYSLISYKLILVN